MDTLYIIMPVYNEEKNIETVVKARYPFVASDNEEFKLVVADGDSLD